MSAYFESKLSRPKTSKLTRIQNIRIIMNYQTVRLASTFASSGCVSSFGSSPKVETAVVSTFGPAQDVLVFKVINYMENNDKEEQYK